MSAPRRPQGVRIEHADGRPDTLCELAYVGVENGQDVWAILTPVDLAHGDRIHADTLPARTSIQFQAPVKGRGAFFMPTDR